MPTHERCPDCVVSRAREDAGALDCRTCGGKGMLRTAASWRCNRCGGSLCPTVSEGDPNGTIPHGLVEAKVHGREASYHLFDCSRYTFSLCEQCLRALFETCVVPPEVRAFPNIGVYGDPGEDVAYAADSAQYKSRVWRDAKEREARFDAGLCNAHETCSAEAKWRLFHHDLMLNDTVCDEHKVLGADRCFVPASAVAGIRGWRRGKDPFYTTDELARVVTALLQAQITDWSQPVWFTHLEGDLKRAVTSKDSVVGALFYPGGYEAPLETETLRAGLRRLRDTQGIWGPVQVELGQFFYGKQSTIRAFAEAGRMPKAGAGSDGHEP